ncbi:UNKNOWN [Stylonychia lemnae]|uniref:tRNA (GuanineN(7))methyltransferase n=1 Tax=Stylonychia lemnae TaxID=5949 RepID=A0A078A4F9_STYLE|nr:UNKNOWN [Stylonychia lemnae]|eukprot:CDW77052.1 UNKNOWN [Stylonychia lemnae]
MPFMKEVLGFFCLRRYLNGSVAARPQRQSLLEEDEDEDQDSVDRGDSNKQEGLGLRAKKSYVEKLKSKLRLSGYSRKNAKSFEDPFIKYGYGVVAFFKLLRLLILLFSCLTMLAMPSILIYQNHDNMSSYYGIARTTMGNLGSSYSKCFQAPVELNSLHLTCGDYRIGEVSSLGIIPFHSDNNERTCVNRDNEPCKNIFSSGFFAKQEEVLAYKRKIGLLGVCLGIFMCMIYVFVIYFQYQSNELDSILWDIQTVTINDYSVELKLNQKILKAYEDQCSQNEIPDGNKGANLSSFLKDYIEVQTQQYAIELDRDDLIELDKLRVAMIEFDFRRGNLLKLLIQRGQYIKQLNFTKRRDIEAKINRFILLNQNNLEKPLCAFVTFEHTEGHNFFIQMIKDNTPRDYVEYRGIEAETAPLPTNIVWQQRNKSVTEIRLKRFLSVILIFSVLCTTMFFVFLIRQYGSQGVSPFSNQNCKWVWRQYGDKLQSYAQFAFNESEKYFESYLEQQVDQEDLNLVGCYCIKHDQNSILYNGFRRRYQLENKDINQNITLTADDKRMCTKFEMNYLSAQIVNQLASQTIILLNFVLRYIIIFIVKYVGYSTESLQTSRIMIFIFIVQFINTDLIILLMNSDITQAKSIFLIDFNGQHPDFTIMWYRDIGLTLINAMLFNVYWPVLEFIVFYGIRLFFRQLDRGWSTQSWRTKCFTISQYIDIHGGPEYTIHYKYSAILNITYITFMFGAGMPVLFPIALASFLTLYFMERLMVAYSYRQPPMFDATLNRQVLRILLYAPLLYCTVGYWMFNNIQIFSTEVQLMKTLNDIFQANHTIRNSLKFNFATPLLIILGLFLFVMITQRWTMKIVERMLDLDPAILLYKPEEQVSFIEGLNKEQRHWLIKEEEKSREKFGIKKLSDEFIDKLHNSKYSKETELLGVMSYQVLDNPAYQNLLQYVPEILDDRDKYIIDDQVINALGQSDYLKKILNSYYQSSPVNPSLGNLVAP